MALRLWTLDANYNLDSASIPNHSARTPTSYCTRAHLNLLSLGILHLTTGEGGMSLNLLQPRQYLYAFPGLRGHKRFLSSPHSAPLPQLRDHEKHSQLTEGLNGWGPSVLTSLPEALSLMRGSMLEVWSVWTDSI